MGQVVLGIQDGWDAEDMDNYQRGQVGYDGFISR
jgi:hypothetical protein